jgi:peptidoglycan/xylan/chitin deacetylase (PgdA/CDA1 family)
LQYPWTRVQNHYRRTSARRVFKKPLTIRSEVPLISFTFDDFPRSALVTGGAILRKYSGAGTYYVSLGILGQDSPSGPLCVIDDLKAVLAQGHELGCHTFSHCDSWQTDPKVFEESVQQNRAALAKFLPGAEFKTMSFPKSEPRPTSKRRAAQYFQCCRSGGQTLNTGTVDLNQLSAYFLEKGRDKVHEIKDLIDRNCRERGWIIFGTHDVAENPSEFGCTPAFFEEIVQYGVKSGARILPVVQALAALRGSV